MARLPNAGTARQPQPAVRKSGDPSNTVDHAVYSALFVSMVLSMTWQLAVVVIVPIVGGYWLDQRFGSSPILTLAGLALAILGMIWVLWRTVRTANTRVAEVQKRGRP